MSDVTEQIKERLSVAELIGEYLRLEKAGSNYKALCPFHNEKTPSFMINTERNFWYCFGCQKGGDIFSFVQEMEGLEFRETLEKLAERTNVELPRFNKAQRKEEKSQRQKTLEILELTTKVYEYFLQKHPQAEKIKVYLKEREVTSPLIEQFRLGCAPDGWENILKYLKKKGYLEKDIVLTGLLVNKENGKYYDRFRERIMFPILDLAGKVVGYSARIAPGGDEKNAKYINTPETLVYNKSKILYGLHESKVEIKKQDSVIVVEGNMDVILSHRAGIKNIVAVSGTALTEEQVKIIKRYTNNIKLSLDMDEAGQKATEKSIRICLLSGMEVSIISLPNGMKDVGDLVKSNPDEWKDISQKSQPVMEYYFKTIFQKYEVDNIQEKKKIASYLLNVIKDISDLIERNYWIKKLASRLLVEEEMLTDILEKIKLRDKTKVTQGDNEYQEGTEKENKDRKNILEEQLLGLFILFPDDLKMEVDKFDEGLFSRTNLILWRKIKGKNFEDDKNIINKLAVKVKYSYDKNVGLIENEIKPLEEWGLIKNELLKEINKRKVEKIILDIKRAEEESDDEVAEILLTELRKLKKE